VFSHVPCRYSIDKERRLVICTGWGRLTFADMRAQQDELTGSPDFDPTFHQLVDVTGVTVLDLSVEEAKAIAKRGIYSPTSRRAVVAASPAVFGMARLMDVYHSLATGREQVRVFYDGDAALQWLGLEPSRAPVKAEEATSVDRDSAANNGKIA
jgi:hypothetical protein